MAEDRLDRRAQFVGRVVEEPRLEPVGPLRGVPCAAYLVEQPDALERGAELVAQRSVEGAAPVPGTLVRTDVEQHEAELLVTDVQRLGDQGEAPVVGRQQGVRQQQFGTVRVLARTVGGAVAALPLLAGEHRPGHGRNGGRSRRDGADPGAVRGGRAR
ncbi:MAG TPA: hypothetical protein DEQ61_05355, partial [Streptomyces sp.]|nr:hypothetical protein [Streptomyces sp.]